VWRRTGWSAVVHAGLAVLAGLVAGVGLIAVISAGFALSFDAIRTVGRASGIRDGWVWLLPAAIDGAMAVVTVTAVVVRRLGNSTAYPWTVVLANAAISVSCNALHAYAGGSMVLPVAVAMAVSAVPAINLALSVHLLVALVDSLADVVTGGVGEDGGRALIAEDETLPGSSVSEDTGPAADGPTGQRGIDLQRQAWQWAQERLLAEGVMPSGHAIAAAHGRSARWGRNVKRAGLLGRI
jgi:hypothetical protein